MIKRSTIDQVFETARVEEVIGDFVQLKRSGSNLKGLSPFTNERTPSFMVSPVKQIWKDFSSGKGGNVVSFLMEHEHFTYPEAIRYLAKRYGIEIEETEQTDEEKQKNSERESMYLVNEFAKTYFQEQLTQTEKGRAIGGTYFKERSFSEQSIKDFELGYAPDKWEAFTQTALKKGYQLNFLEKTGLTIVRKDAVGRVSKKFDRFKGRVIFPIHSMSGRVLGFGGRILANNEKTAKYLNSPESDIYHKSKIVYGIYQAKKAIAKKDCCYLVEGYADVVQLHQNGIKNVVASSGTALTPAQIHLINRLTQHIVVLYDGDAAGTRASLRGIDLILEQGMNVKICAFPEGQDPDDFAKAHTTEEIEYFLENESRDFIAYKAAVLMKEAQNDPIKKADVIRDMMRSISKIPDNIRQELYLKEVQKIMDISEEVLYSTLAQIQAKNEADRNRRSRAKQKRNRRFEVVKEPLKPKLNVDPQYEIERHIISLLLNYGEQEGLFRDFEMHIDEEGELFLEEKQKRSRVYEKILLDLQGDEIEFTNPAFKAIYEPLIQEFKLKQALKVEEFVTKISPELSAEVTSILMENEKYKLHRWKSQNIYVQDKSELDEREVQQTILNLRMRLIKKKTLELLDQMEPDKTVQNHEILEEISNYKQLQVLIARKLNSVIHSL